MEEALPITLSGNFGRRYKSDFGLYLSKALFITLGVGASRDTVTITLNGNFATSQFHLEL